MDPASFTKTSFCGKEVDNITKNEDKQYILQLLKLRSNGLHYAARYAKIYNEQYSKNLSNPHILCLKSSGTPYLLFLTQINDINYCFLIDKKIKEGYDYPKIFVVPYHFTSELYTGTIFETELLRDRNNVWSLLIGDIYMYRGELMKQTIIVDRMNKINSIFSDEFTKNEFGETCSVSIKKYFDMTDIDYAINEFPKSLSYDIRGIYFIPIRVSYSNILYLFPRNQNKRSIQVTTKQTSGIYNFHITRTMKPDIYELYAKGDHNLIKQGYAYVRDIKQSMYLYALTQGSDDIIIECSYNQQFKKWEPKKQTQHTISLSKNISV